VKGDGLAMMTAEQQDMAIKAHGSVARYRRFVLRNRVENWLYWHFAAPFTWPRRTDETLTELDDRLYKLEKAVESMAGFASLALNKLGCELEADVILASVGRYEEVPEDRRVMYAETGDRLLKAERDRLAADVVTLGRAVSEALKANDGAS
jgi:hypothetical protein